MQRTSSLSLIEQKKKKKETKSNANQNFSWVDVELSSVYMNIRK